MTDLYLLGDTRQRVNEVARGTVHTCVTSPPYYGLRDYGVTGQIGLESTPEEYVRELVEVFRGVRHALRDDGTLWLNLGDSYASASAVNAAQHGMKVKDLIGIPWMVAFALRADGWYLRSDIIWHKPNPMPEPVKDRPTKAHEYLFLLSKGPCYYYDAAAIREPAVQAGRVRADQIGGNKGTRVHHSPGSVFRGADTRNRRSVWTVTTQPFAGAHFATMPQALAEPCILAGSPVDGVVLDPFGGAGTTALVARRNRRRFVHIELNPEYMEIAQRRIEGSSAPPGGCL